MPVMPDVPVPDSRPESPGSLPPTLPDRLTILYTACLHGEIEALPRLFTLIKRERAALPGVATLLIDLGESCIPGTMPCDLTGGRALLVAMDALGYDAFFLDHADPLFGDRETLGKLQSIVVTPIVSADRPIALRKYIPGGSSLPIVIAGYDFARDQHLRPITALTEAPLLLRLALADPESRPVRCDKSEANRYTVLLADRWDGVQMGRLDISLAAGRIESHLHRTLPPDLPPDPTVSGVIDFVLGEARYSQRRGQRQA